MDAVQVSKQAGVSVSAVQWFFLGWTCSALASALASALVSHLSPRRNKP